MLLALAFVEGAAVMAIELMAGQLLSPSFGDSLTTWMWVLICTMVGLTLGYYVGAFLGGGVVRQIHACWALLVGLVYAAAIPIWYTPLLTHLLNLPIAVATPLAATSIFLVPMGLFGLVPGFLVSAAESERHAEHPSMAGTIFAFSTCGGIVSAFLVGLVLVPALGVSQVLRCMALILGLLPGATLILAHRYRAVLITSIAVIVILLASRKSPSDHSEVAILDFQEGLMGQLMVADEKEPGQPQYRYLYVNRTAQTRIKPGEPYVVREQFSYVQSIAPLLGTVPRNSKVLLLGLGGGALVKLIQSMGFDLTVVEIDPRIISVAKRFFDLPAELRVELGDARRYLRLTDRTFDVIVFDVYRGEFLPAHVLTLEALRDLETKLSPGGMVLINVIGADTGPFGAVTQSVVKTLRVAGWRCNVIGPKTQMNTIIIADKGDHSYGMRINDSPSIDGFPLAETLFTPVARMEEAQRQNSAIPVLTDDRPVIDRLNQKVVASTRQWYIQTAVKRHLKGEIPLFR